MTHPTQHFRYKILQFQVSSSMNVSKPVCGLGSTFKYFAYGSNLSEKRIHINNPTAKRVSSGMLNDYRLDFNYFSKRWGGNAATIVPEKLSSVWGAIWEIDKCNEADLDRQEGVGNNIYRTLQVDVVDSAGKTQNCRTYMLCQLPPNANIAERPPSKIYLDTIISGAKETGLPEDYIKKLESIPHNNYTGPIRHDID
ncbi:gamma-glutamylcyclotransferase-like isoform X2 [Cimex lectularius]|uniref:gamma-glutamylcyclotransferase n=2 Tax=Cimex lectularius TaxID=79782 RepID=A0A8I6S4B6_CIMLE|nr:gamma-glutamylcyclotransferase-like isoform X2 [Cimex lectularius]